MNYIPIHMGTILHSTSTVGLTSGTQQVSGLGGGSTKDRNRRISADQRGRRSQAIRTRLERYLHACPDFPSKTGTTLEDHAYIKGGTTSITRDDTLRAITHYAIRIFVNPSKLERRCLSLAASCSPRIEQEQSSSAT